MWNRFIQFIDDIRFKRFMRMKAKVNRCCDEPCPDPICQKIGCLNQDGTSLRPRIKLLLLRVSEKYEKPNRKLIIEKVEPPTNIVDINEFRKNK